MKTKIKRVLSFLLLVTVCVTNIQVPALAAENYSVTVADTEHGKVLLNGEEKDINLEKGAEVIISAVPAEGYKLESIAAIKEDGSENGLKEVENGYVTKIQDSNVTVEASFTRDATTSDLEALFGPKEGEEDTRLSAKAWKQTQKAQETDRSAYTDYTASRQWYDVTIGTNDDGGNIIWQWTEGMLYVGGRLTFCMDAKTSFYEGVEYTPTDASALGLSQAEVTRLALYQEYIYNQRTDLDELGKYMFSQMLMWRELNEYFSWGWPNIHIFDAGYWWADVSYQDQVLREAVEWVTEQQQSGRYTGHGEFFVHSYSQAQAIFWLEENTGGLELYKKSKKPEITDGNSAYSLAGAQYGVYRDGGDYVTPDAVITTDENGYGWVDGLLAGNYWIKELVAPKGYALDPSWSSTTVAVPGGSYGRYYTSDLPITDPVNIVLGKVDADKTSGMTEAELKKLEGAQFEVKYYAVDPNAYNSDPSASGVKAARTWIIQTLYSKNEKAVTAKLDTKHKVSGDDFYLDDQRTPTFPVGVITIKEIKAPKGYLVSNEVFIRKVTEDGADKEVVNTYNAPIVEEVAQKMQIHLQKIDKETGKAEAQGTGTLKGAVYEVKDTAGKTVDTLTTDAVGKATSKELPIAAYTVKETKASNGYILDEKTYTVKGEAIDSTTRVFRYDVKSQETPQKVQIRLKKTDSENGTAQGTATLKGAVYEVRNSNNTVVDTLTTDESGNAISKKLPLDVYTVKETKASYGYLLDEKTYTIEGKATDTTTQVFEYTVNSKETPQKIQIQLNKVDAENGTAQGTATLKDAKYEVRNSKNQVVETLTTNESGKATSSKLPLGTYTVKETKASYGYLLDEKTYTIEGNATDTTTQVFQYAVTSKETPQKIQIELSKLDSETNKGEAQGAATLKGAKYEIRNSKNEVVETLITNEKGKAVSKELPLDRYVVKETASSNGYLIDENGYTVDGEATDTTTRVFRYKVNSKEAIIRGNVEIIKLKENEDEDNDTLQGLEGVEFTFTSKTSGKEVLKITTDKYGFATTASKENPRGGLVYDTYIITETKCPEGLKPIKPFEVTIKDEGVTLKGIYKEDKLIVSPITVVKIDASTGKVIPVKNTEFRLLDSEKNPITMTTYYPNKVVHETFKTDENGQFTFPEKLKYGTYYLEELHAPEGYLKGELLQFKVTDGATWENPLVVQYADENAMGKIKIQKADAETQSVLANAVFEITAAEDIVTPDGTVRLQKGEVADTITTNEEGKAESKALFLGRYIAKEKQQPNGYLLNEEEFQVELKYKDQETALVYKNVSVTNTPTRIQLFKTDKETKQPIAGATFAVWNKAMEEGEDQAMGMIETFVTDENGMIELKYLAPGTYCWQEKEVVPGYVLSDEIHEITIDADGRVSGEDVGVIKVQNDFTKIQFIKYDAESGKSIAGGKFQVIDLDGNVVDEWTGKEEPHTINYLTVGKEYIFKEIEAPKGYVLAEDVHFVVERTAEIQTIEMYDSNAMGQIHIQKVDAETSEALKYATFEITAEEDIVTPDGTTHLKKGDVADTITTDENGMAVSKKLYLGKYKIQETKQPDGYLLDETVYHAELKYKDQNTALITESFQIANTPTEVEVLKTDKETGKPMAGVEFAVWNKAMAGEDQDIALVQNFVTDKDGKINIKRLAPGTYCFQETKTVPGYVLDEKIYEVTIDKDGLVEGKKIGKLEITNIPTKLIGTTARDQQTQTHEAVPKKETTFVDTVEFKNLQIGQEYTIKGVLMDKATGEPLLIHNKEVTAETTFTAEKTDGTVDVVFTFDASALKGHSIVVFEKVFIGEKEILAHEDIHDKEQTITFPNSEIKTTAVDKDTQKHEGHVRKETTIVDTVSYKNLIIGQEYIVKGTLMNKESGKPFMVNDKKVTAEKTFKPEKSSGSITLEFVFDSSALKGKSVVVFEKLFVENTEVAVHEDISDVKQTVSFPDSKIETTAVDKDTQMHEGLAKKETTIVDTVSYKGLIPGEEYTVKGTLMSKETGEALLIDEKPVTAEKTFQPEKADGTVDLEFTFNSSVLKGKTVVVFEKVYRDELEVAVHADIEDQEQSVSFPEIHTNAIDRDTKTHETMPKQEAVIVDTVTYKNLSVGQEYTLKGILMDKETGEPLLINGEQVVSEATFLPDQSDGSVDVEFTFDASALKGKSVVVFERLYVKETEVAVHTDITDEGQTITFLTPPEAPPVKTGDSNGIPGSLIALLFGSAAVIGFILYRKKKQA